MGRTDWSPAGTGRPARSWLAGWWVVGALTGGSGHGDVVQSCRSIHVLPNANAMYVVRATPPAVAGCGGTAAVGESRVSVGRLCGSALTVRSLPPAGCSGHAQCSMEMFEGNRIIDAGVWQLPAEAPWVLFRVAGSKTKEDKAKPAQGQDLELDLGPDGCGMCRKSRKTVCMRRRNVSACASPAPLPSRQQNKPLGLQSSPAENNALISPRQGDATASTQCKGRWPWETCLGRSDGIMRHPPANGPRRTDQ